MGWKNKTAPATLVTRLCPHCYCFMCNCIRDAHTHYTITMVTINSNECYHTRSEIPPPSPPEFIFSRRICHTSLLIQQLCRQTQGYSIQ